MLCRSVVAGAVPVWIGDRLNAERHVGNVVHAGSDAVYFTSGDDVIGVVSRHAAAIPCVIATRLERMEDLFDGGRLPPVGEAVSIGAGSVRFTGGDVRVGRYLSFDIHRFQVADAPTMRARLADFLEEPAAPAAAQEISAEDRALLATHPDAALTSVLGRGSGLTPFGDDVVCGLLATLLAARHPAAPGLRQRVLELAPHRTTKLSTTLLRRAAAGDVLPAFANVVSDLARSSDRLAPSIATLRSVGHTSGAGMLLGMYLGLEHITMRSCS